MTPIAEEIREQERPASCPACGSGDVVKVVYGLVEDPRAFAGQRVELGGCCVGPGSPAFRCGECRHAWGTESERNEWTAVFIAGPSWRGTSP